MSLPVKKRLALLVMVVLLVAAGVWLSGRGTESTDDAYIAGRVVSIAPKVSGYITHLTVVDNQTVRAGELLAEIDPTDYRNRVEALQASVAAAQADLVQAQSDLERVRAQSNLSASAQARQQAETRSKIAQARVGELTSQLAQAQADLASTRLIAPQDGTIAKRLIEQGSYVEPGQALMAVVGTDRWVVANFKESQLSGMTPGQPADIRIDAYPGLTLTGTVDSLQSGTGSSFSAFPPENATGNFVKIVQRLPVKITFTQPLPDVPLAIGLSVVPTVNTR